MEVVVNTYKVIAHCYCIMWGGGGGHLTVHKLDCLGEEADLVPGCPGNCGSVALTRWQKFKKGMTWM